MRSFSRAAVATGLAAMDRTVLLDAYPKQTWPQDRDVPLILRTVPQVASTTNTAALAAIGVAYLSSLKPASAGANLLSRGLQLRFENRTSSSIGVPNLALPDAAFVAEGEADPVASAPGTGVRLWPHKLGIIATATAELLRNSNAEDLLRSVLIEASALTLDRAIFSADPATDARPAGLLFGIPPLPSQLPWISDEAHARMLDGLRKTGWRG